MIKNFNSLAQARTVTRELSRSRYNFVIGASLVWGFVLNLLLMHFSTPAIMQMLYMNPDRYSTFMIGFVVVYFILVLIGSGMLRSYSTLKCFIGYNLIALPVGLLVTMATIGYDPHIVTRAFLITAIITCLMMLVSMAFPASFASMGGGLSVALLAVIIVEALSMLFFRADFALLDYAVIAIMSLYIGYDWVRANSVRRSAANAIAAASALYLDIINIFLRVLRLLARSRDD